MQTALRILSVLAVLTGAAQAAQAAEPITTEFAVAQPGDAALDCAAINREIAAMEDIIIENEATQRAAKNTGTGITIAKAVGGFLIGSVPGAIGVMAAGYAAGEVAEDRAETADGIADSAALRRSMMIGMYNAKACKGPLHSPQSIKRVAVKYEDIEPAAGPRNTHSTPARYND